MDLLFHTIKWCTPRANGIRSVFCSFLLKVWMIFVFSPQQLFNCQALKKLSMPDNDLSNLPTTIASLVNLKELDISKNGNKKD